MKPKVVAFIPARGGSKGLPGKNIRPLLGKPLIAWSIEQASSCSDIDKVFVSTDSAEIANVARQYGAEVPFLRPSDISTDVSTTESAMSHFLQYCDSNSIQCDALMLMQATSPVRRKGVLTDAIRHFYASDADSLLTVSQSHRFFWKNSSQPLAMYDYENRPRRQDLKESELNYMETGSFYITKVDQYRNTENRLGGKIVMFECSEEEAFEIDSLMDFKVCEAVLSSMIESELA